MSENQTTLSESPAKTQQRPSDRWNALASARFGLEVATSQVALSQDNLRIQRAKYASGEANIVDVVEAETLLAQSQANQALARLAIARQQVVLRLASAM